MQKIISIVPAAPLRADASHRSEMVSQLLLGETAEVLEETRNFIKVKTDLNEYIGWIQTSQLTDFSNEVLPEPSGFADEESIITFNSQPMKLSLGTPVYNITVLASYPIDYSNASYRKNVPFTESDVKAIAFKYINVSYLWGGRSSFGIDCSGFAQSVYAFFGIFLPRDAYQQAESGLTVDFLSQAHCGDLAFFDNEDGKIVHVGILSDYKTIIHSAGRVRIDTIDGEGIINNDTGMRTHHLRIIKRIL